MSPACRRIVGGRRQRFGRPRLPGRASQREAQWVAMIARGVVFPTRAERVAEIADSRTALKGQPGSLLAQGTLFDAYRRKVALLQDLIALASDAKRNGLDGRTTKDRS